MVVPVASLDRTATGSFSLCFFVPPWRAFVSFLLISRTWRQQLRLCACWWERARCIVAVEREKCFSFPFFYLERAWEKKKRGNEKKKLAP